MPEIDEILEERGARYGAFTSHAMITQSLKAQVIFDLRARLSRDKVDKSTAAAIVEGMEMIMHKIGRIANGDPLYLDSWDDIAGYATLVAKAIKGE